MNPIENRNKFIGCRVTPSEMADIREHARCAGLTVSDYIRHQVQEEPIIKIYQPKELVYQLLAIGRNINQLTRLCNARQSVDSMTLASIRQEWEMARNLLLAFIAGADAADNGPPPAGGTDAPGEGTPCPL